MGQAPLDPIPAANRPKFGKNALTCGTILAIVLLLFLLVLAYLINQVGIIQFPLLNRFYSPPQPTRQISYQTMDLKDFESLVSARAREGIRAREKKVSVVVSEQELSGLLAWGLSQGLRRDMEIERAQAVVLPTGMELYVQLKWGLGRLDLLVRIKPILQPDGSVKFMPMNAKLGSISLPSWLIMPVISNVFSKDLGSWNLQAGNMKIDSLVLEDGKLSISFK